MNFKPLKQQAKITLANNKMYMLYFLLSFLALIGGGIVCNFIPFVGFIGEILLSVVVSLFLTGTSLQLINNEALDISKVFSKSGKFGCTWLWYLVYNLPCIISIIVFYLCFTFMLLLGIKTALGVSNYEYKGLALLFFMIGALVSFIFSIVWSIKVYFRYYFSYYIALDDGASNLTAKDCLKVSKEMMKGHKFRFFVFQLSFILWYLLVGVTFGIASVYVLPYVQLATAAFYEDIKNDYNHRVSY